MKKTYLTLCASLVLMAPALAGPIAGIDWNCKKNKIIQSIRNSSDLIIADGLDAPADIIKGGCSFSKPLIFQNWKAEFNFDSKKDELTSILFIGSEGFDDTLLDGPLKSYYSFIARALKSEFRLPEKAQNTPHYGDLGDVSAVKFYPIHSYVTYDKLYTIGWHYDAATKKIHAAFTIQQAAIRTGMGTEKQNENTKGTEQEWENITPWEDCPEASDFLVRAGLKVLKKVAPKEEGGAEATVLADPPTEEELAAAKAEEELEASMQAEIDAVDAALAEDDRDLLISLIAQQYDKPKEMANHMVKAAQAGNARAIYHFAKCFAEGIGVDKDAEKAESAILGAAQMGYAPALVGFGGEYKTALAAIGISEEEGIELMKSIDAAVEDGSASARMNKAVMYRFGFGVRKDLIKSQELLKGLEAQGDIEAAEFLKTQF